MTTRSLLHTSLVVTLLAASFQTFAACHEILNFDAQKLRSSETINFCEAFEGKTLLVVNTASQCGYTPQFKQLESLHQAMSDSVAVVGIPSDDFNQEYDDAEKVAEVCYKNYGVSFTMLETSAVKGEAANTLHKRLIERTGQEPTWNFNKYVVSADGKKVKHLPSSVIGDDLVQAINEIEN